MTALALTPAGRGVRGAGRGAPVLDEVHARRSRRSDDSRGPASDAFRRLTRPLIAGMGIAWVGLVGLVMQLRL